MNKGVKIMVGVTLGILLLCGVGLAIIGTAASDATQTAIRNATPADAPPASTEESETPTPAQSTPKPTKAPETIGEGEWVVGADVSPGTYRTPGAKEGLFEFCMWEVLASDEQGADTVDVGTVTGPKEPGRVRIKKGQVLKTSGCQDWSLTK